MVPVADLPNWPTFAAMTATMGLSATNNPWPALNEGGAILGETTTPKIEQVKNRINRLIDSDSDVPELNLDIKDLARLIGDSEDAAWEYAAGTCKETICDGRS